MKSAKLSAAEVAEKSQNLPEWSAADNELRRQFEFPGFVEAMVFVNRIADAADGMNHHPDIDIRYNRVMLALSTHDAGGLTTLDFELAALIDGLSE